MCSVGWAPNEGCYRPVSSLHMLHIRCDSWGCVQDGAGALAVSQEQIHEIVGEGARDRGGKGNANVGDGGVAFVLSSSGPSPGGSETVSISLPQLHANRIIILFPSS